MSETIETTDGAPHGARQPDGPAWVRWASAAIRYWALAGGVILLGVAVMTGLSALSKIFLGGGWAFEHEMVKHFSAIAIFSFLPYCQLVQANISVDIFTAGMSERAKLMMAGFAGLFAVAFAILMLRQMSQGFESYLRFPEVTPVLRLPLWTAFPPILVSLALLLVAAVITVYESLRDIRGLKPADA